MLRALAIALALLALAPAHAVAVGTFSVVGSAVVFEGDPDEDKIAGYETDTEVRFTRFGGADLEQDAGCTVSDDKQSVVCRKSAGDGVKSVILNLGGGDDVATISLAMKLPVIFLGGAGNDGLFGGGGVDIFDGGSGADNIVSRDGLVEQVTCGTDEDTAISDDNDVRDSCEQIEGDADLDGVRRPADCNDTSPAIRPGATDVPDNGVDENCDGADATDLDRDRDGIARPQDCDDGDPAIRPGAREIRGNAVDENCDTRIDPFPPLLGSIGVTWSRAGSGTRNVRLVARKFLRGATIEVRCTGRGCPSRTFRRTVRRSNENLHAALGERVIRRGARLEVRVTSASRIGRVLRFRFSKPGEPAVDFLCLPPGGGTRDC